MDKVQNKCNWFLVSEHDNGKIAKYPCPNAAIGDIIKILFEHEQGKTCLPTKEITESFKKILISKVITIKMISQLTGLSELYLERLKNGMIEEAETKKIVKLTEIIDKGERIGK